MSPKLAVAKTSKTAVRDRLIEAARIVFADQGYARATTREIATKAGTSEVMLFRYYGSKSNLFKESVFDYLDDKLSRLISKDFDPSIPSRRHWNEYSENVLGILDQNKSLLSALIAAFDYESSEISDISDMKSLDHFFEIASESLGGYFRETADPMDARIVVRLIFGLMAAVTLFKGWLFPSDLASEEMVAQTLTRFVARSLLLSTTADDGAA